MLNIEHKHDTLIIITIHFLTKGTFIQFYQNIATKERKTATATLL